MANLKETLQKAEQDGTLALLHIDLQTFFFREDTPVHDAYKKANELDRALAPLTEKGSLQKIWCASTGRDETYRHYSEFEINGDAFRQICILQPHKKDIVFCKSKRSITANNDFIPYLQNNHINTLIVDGVFADLCVRDSLVEIIKAHSDLKRPLNIVIAHEAIDNTPDPKRYLETIIQDTKLAHEELKAINILSASNNEIASALNISKNKQSPELEHAS